MDSGRLAGNDFHSFVSDDAQNGAVRERIKAARAALQTRGCIGVMMRRNMMRGYLPDRRRKKALNVSSGLLYLFDAWQFPTLAWGDPTLPSALRRFTSEFGMGSGGTTALLPPGKFCFRPRLSRSDCVAPLAPLSHILLYAPSRRLACRPVTAQNPLDVIR